MLDLNPYVDERTELAEECGLSEARLQFATGSIPLIQAVGHRFVRIADRTSEAPMGLWIVC